MSSFPLPASAIFWDFADRLSSRRSISLPTTPCLAVILKSSPRHASFHVSFSSCISISTRRSRAPKVFSLFYHIPLGIFNIPSSIFLRPVTSYPRIACPCSPSHSRCRLSLLLSHSTPRIAKLGEIPSFNCLSHRSLHIPYIHCVTTTSTASRYLLPCSAIYEIKWSIVERTGAASLLLSFLHKLAVIFPSLEIGRAHV